MKSWQSCDDFVLRNLSTMIIDRDLLKIKMKRQRPAAEDVKNKRDKLMEKYGISEEEASYFVFTGEISNQAYQLDAQQINILYKSGRIKDIVKASDQLNLKALSTPVTKYFVVYPKDA